jgi:hypothetical protein
MCSLLGDFGDILEALEKNFFRDRGLLCSQTGLRFPDSGRLLEPAGTITLPGSLETVTIGISGFLHETAPPRPTPGILEHSGAARPGLRLMGLVKW